MKLYNTLTRKVEDFTPQNPKEVKIYTCGPTVYSYAHIGNYTAYIYWDLLVRALKAEGYGVKRVMNITDVGHLTSDADDGEDKMEKGARREGKTVWEVAQFYMDDYLKHFEMLNLLEPSAICRATDYIEADKKIVDILDEKGYLYDTTDGLYFDTSKFERYADFARLDLEHLQAGARIEFNSEKRNVSDFAVWKWIRDGEDHAMKWEYRERMGYPGWHLECSTIIHEVLGEPIDIHTGGIDHIMIHHTNEIAQSEAAFGKSMSNYWLHCNFITINGEKISKSLGNTYTFEDLIERGFTPLDFKMWIYQGHFRSERDFTFTDLSAARQRLLNYRNFAALRWQRDVVDFTTTREAMMTQISNNLNTAGALAELDKSIKDDVAPNDDFIKFLDGIFGLDIEKSSPDISDEQKEKIAARVKAKEMKDYVLADKLRDELLDEGIAIRDTVNGPIWEYR